MSRHVPRSFPLRVPALVAWGLALAGCGGGGTPEEPVADEPVVGPETAANPDPDPELVAAQAPGVEDEGPRAHPDDPDGWTPLVAFQGEPIDVERVFRDDGTLERITCHLRGKRGPASLHGPEWMLFPNGLSRLRQTWVSGSLEGPFAVYWPNGILRQEGTYRAGQRDGVFVQYFRTGDRNLEYHYEEGVPQGLWREWIVEGELALEENYRDGLKHGLCRRWGRPVPPEGFVPPEGQEDGTATGGPSILHEEAEYVDGVLQGAWADYWPTTGHLRRTGRMENGLKLGEWRAYREDGSLKAVREFVAGVQEGPETLYDEGGARIAENQYVEGVQEGLQRAWYPDGQLQAEGEMRSGLREGPWTYYRPDGSVDEAWTGSYREGQRLDD